MKLTLLFLAFLAISNAIPVTDNTPAPIIASQKPIIDDGSTPFPSSPSASDIPIMPIASARCGGDFILTTPNARGYLNSPNFPLEYPANITCLWKISGPEGFRVKMELQMVDTELTYDTISLHASLAPVEHNRIFSLSGKDTGRAVLFGSNNASVVFVSDAYVTAGGFLATFHLVADDEEMTSVGHSATILSPAYPQTFMPSMPLIQPGDNAKIPSVLHTYTLNVSASNGMYIRFPNTEIGDDVSIKMEDVAENCDLDSSRSLTTNDTTQTYYSECSSVKVTVVIPPGQSVKYRVEMVEVCQQWNCYPDYYFGQYSALFINVMFFLMVVTLLAGCCCCCEKACRTSKNETGVRRRRVRGRAFDNPTFQDAPALPTKAPVATY